MIIFFEMPSRPVINIENSMRVYLIVNDILVVSDERVRASFSFIGTSIPGCRAIFIPKEINRALRNRIFFKYMDKLYRLCR